VGLDLLTLPIHILHELQPLDVSVFKPFKIAFRKLQDIWSLSNKHCGKIGQLKATKGTKEVVKLEKTQKTIAKNVSMNNCHQRALKILVTNYMK
jgi:hypothetical protein